ncbi:sulfotransferase family 2 domain-containing protein [Paraburkholderia sp. BL10I2N1]|uniref:sulfotransferase family 2 domain-containing protein n=1 Tax=Paraburkholderia sp. BL10I2N1 TaxID=1938796 RepID=UPI00105D1F83|nr:sulfotransferase family 2 domain-containing protein [Paraburkholderia sp. BL10I2N1]TDN67237.1 sulfotransferase family protein [Paraburkholderia sp. BL10I2N1]
MKDPLYYLHIPKTGGTSFISFLDNQFDQDEICPAQLLPGLFEIPDQSLRNYSFFRGHLWYGLSSYIKRNLTYITMLRDPVQRTISWYSHVKRDENAYRHRRVVDENWSLLDFVQDSETNWDMTNAQTLFFAVDLDYSRLALDPVGYGTETVKQYAQRADDRALLDIAKKRLEEAAFFGITERMQNSMNLLSYRMGFYPDFSAPTLNTSLNRPLDNEISAETIAAINRITTLDQELYEWACGIFEQRLSEMVKSLLVSRYESSSENQDVQWLGPLPVESRKLFCVEIVKAPSEIGLSTKFQVAAAVTNNSGRTIASRNLNPVNISYHWIEKSTGSVAIFDGERTVMSKRLPVGERTGVSVSVESPARAGQYVLRMTIVQEGVAWFDEPGVDVFSDVEIVVQ